MGLVIFILCLFVVILSAARLFIYQKKVKSYFKTTGVVVDNKKDEYSDMMGGGYTHYYPIIKFTTPNGVTQEIVSSIYFEDRPGYNPNTTVNLLVNPTDSTRFVIENKFEGYGVALVWMALGIAGMVAAYFMPEQ